VDERHDCGMQSEPWGARDETGVSERRGASRDAAGRIHV
jgi:hypothetical protein